MKLIELNLSFFIKEHVLKLIDFKAFIKIKSALKLLPLEDSLAMQKLFLYINYLVSLFAKDH